MLTKLLIIRFSSIGDIVLTTPVIRCIKQQWEGEVEIHFLTKKQFAPIVASNPYLSKVHTIEKSVREIIPHLREIGFDYIIDLHHNIRSAIVKNKLKALSFTFNKINKQKWLMVNFKINRLPDVHIVDRYLETLNAFDIKNDGKWLDYFIPEQDEVSISELPETHQKGYIAYAIGAAHYTKSLPVDKIITLCQKINKPIVLLGDEKDKEKGEKIKAKVGNKIYNACGLYNIHPSASLLKQADKVITHDSGLMHIAAALQKNIVSIWGNTIPAFGMYPYLPESMSKSTLIQVKDLRCRPCSKIGFSKCPKKHFYCMKLINIDEIVEALL